MTLVKWNGGLRSPSLFPRTSLFDDFFSDWPFDGGSEELQTEWVPAANIKETDKKFALELSVPGYTKKNIHVEVDSDDMLILTGEREEVSKEELDKYNRREFSHGSFKRSFKLPETIDQSKVTAKCQDGVLFVELPKKEVSIKKTKVKEIKIS